jgi:hypothetical protein
MGGCRSNPRRSRIFGVLVAAYTAIVVGVRRREQRKIAEALAVERYVSSVLPDPALLSTLSAEQRRVIMKSISEAGRRKVVNAMSAARFQSAFAAIGALLATIALAVAVATTQQDLSDVVNRILAP